MSAYRNGLPNGGRDDADRFRLSAAQPRFDSGFQISVVSLRCEVNQEEANF